MNVEVCKKSFFFDKYILDNKKFQLNITATKQ